MYSDHEAGLIEIVFSISELVTDRVPEIGFSSIRNQPKNEFKKQFEQSFSSFFAKFFGIFDDFSKFRF